MAQTMKEIIGEAYANVSEERLRDLLPDIARDAKGNDFVNPDAELSSMIRQCLDESTDGGMIGLLLPENGSLPSRVSPAAFRSFLCCTGANSVI